MAIHLAHPLHGLVPAAHTPFLADGSLNLAMVERQAAHFLANHVKTVFVGGSTGECHSLTLEERRQLAQRWSEVVRGTGLKLVVHVGANCLADSRTLAAQAESLQAVAISALAPSYFRPRDVEALIACCADVASAAPGTPFYFYDIPGMTGVNLSMPDFLARAPERIPTLAGIKFTNSDLMSYQLCLRTHDGRFDVPYGTDEWLLAACALGEAPDVVIPSQGIHFREVIIGHERRYIEAALEAAGGVQKKAAELLHIKATTLNEMMKRYDIRPKRRKGAGNDTNDENDENDANNTDEVSDPA